MQRISSPWLCQFMGLYWGLWLLSSPLTSGSGAEPAAADKKRDELANQRDMAWAAAHELRAAGKLPQAQASGERVLALERELLGSEDVELVSTLEFLAELAIAQEQFDKAKLRREEALKILIKALGEDNYRASDARWTLGHLTKLQQLTRAERSKLNEAAEFLAKASAFTDQEPPDEQAIALCDRACGIIREVLGDGHRLEIEALYKLGNAQRALGKYEAAEFALTQGLKLAEKIYGSQHPVCADGQNYLGAVAYADERLETAERWFRRALEVQRKADGEKPSQLAETYQSNLLAALESRAALLFNDQRLADARPLWVECQKICEDHWGASDNRTIEAAMSLARVEKLLALTAVQRKRYWQAEDDWNAALDTDARLTFAAARERLERARQTRADLLGKDDYDTAEADWRLGELLIRHGSYAEAIPRLQQASTVFNHRLGVRHEQCAEVLESLASGYAASGDHVQGQARYAEAVKIRRQLSEDEPVDYWSWLDAAAQSQIEGEYFKCGLALLEQVLSHRRQEQGQDHSQYRELRDHVAEFYQTWFEAVTHKPSDEEIKAEYEWLVDHRLAFERREFGQFDSRVEETLLGYAIYLEQVKHDLPAALRCHQERLASLSRRLPADHPKLGDANYAVVNLPKLASLTTVQQLQAALANRLLRQAADARGKGDAQAAVKLVEQAQTIRKQIFGDKHPHYAEALQSSGKTQLQLGNYDAARTLFQAAAEIHQNVFGKKHPTYAASLRDLALVDQRTLQYPQAERLYRQAFEISQFAGYDVDVAISALAKMLQEWSERLWQEGDVVRAQECLAEAVRLVKQFEKPQIELSADLERDLVDVQKIAKLPAKDRERLRAARRSLALLEGRPAGNVNQEEIARAAGMLAVEEELLGGEYRHRALHLNQVGRWCAELGDDQAAIKWFRQAVAASEKLYGERSEFFFALAFNLGRILLELEQNAEAETTLARAETSYRQVLDNKKNNRFLASVISTHGESCYELGQYRRAKALFIEALEVYEEVANAGLHAPKGFGMERQYAQQLARSGGSEEYVKTMRLLALTSRFLGDYASAIDWSRRVVEIQRAAVGESHVDYVLALNALSSAYIEGADFDIARTVIEEELAVHARLGADTTGNRLGSLANLGWVEFRLGNSRRAKTLYEEAKVGFEKLNDTKSIAYAHVLDNLGLTTTALGEHQSAEQYFNQALRLKEKLVGKNHTIYAYSCNNLGELLLKTGQAERSLPWFRQAVDIHARSGGQRHNEYLNGLQSLADAYLAVGDRVNAQQRMQQALELSRQRLNDMAMAQSERQQLQAASFLRYRLDRYLTLAAEADKASADEYEFVLAWKGSVLRRQWILRKLRTSAFRDGARQGRLIGVAANDDGTGQAFFMKTKGYFEQLQQVSTQLSLLAHFGSSDSEPAERMRIVRELTEQRERLTAEILSAEKSDALAAQVTPSQLQQALPNGAVLIDLLEYEHRTRGPLSEQPPGERRLRAYVIRADMPIKAVELGPAATVSQAVDAWRERIHRADLQGERRAGLKLRELVWDKLVEPMGDSRVVLISPDGPLTRVPFAALPAGENGYLLEQYGLAMIPAPQILPELLADEPRAAQLPSLLLLGAVEFNRAADAQSSTSEPAESAAGGAPPLKKFVVRKYDGHWPPLPGTEVEITAVGETLQRQHPGAAVTVLRGAESTETSVRKHMEQSHYLHFATHGFFNQSQAAMPDARASDISHTFSSEIGHRFPGVLSGLVLAGANSLPRSLDSDALLTAVEVAELDLSRVDLATLSACETGLGKEAAGEGLLGLQRAFHAAGAQTVVAGLWQVPDRATSLLMERFYDNLWQKRMSKLAALREAQLWMLRTASKQPELLRGFDQRRGQDDPDPDLARGLERLSDERTQEAERRLSPYYWAAFILSGDWR